MLTELQKDVLGEIVNVYIGQAASLLSEMTGQEIRLNVPQVLLLTGDAIALDSAVTDDIWSQGHIVSSSLRFSQGLHGKTFLMFPAAQAKALVNACLGELDLCTSFSEARDLLDTDFDVLKEVANVILTRLWAVLEDCWIPVWNIPCRKSRCCSLLIMSSGNSCQTSKTSCC